MPCAGMPIACQPNAIDEQVRADDDETPRDDQKKKKYKL